MTDFQYFFKEEFDGFQIKHIKTAQKKTETTYVIRVFYMFYQQK